MQRELTIGRLKQLLAYDPSTGVFGWKGRRKGKKHDGTPGSTDKDGYLIITIDGRHYRAHRLAWFYVYGRFPNREIDHINRDRSDNRISNLRDVGRLKNIINSNVCVRNKTGVKGVHFFKKTGTWRAQIKIHNGKNASLGYYHSFDDAVCARLAAEQCIGYDYRSSAQEYVKEIIPTAIV